MAATKKGLMGARMGFAGVYPACNKGTNGAAHRLPGSAERIAVDANAASRVVVRSGCVKAVVMRSASYTA